MCRAGLVVLGLSSPKTACTITVCYFLVITQVEALRRDGLVVLGLSSAQYRQLGMLREATANLSTSLDALRYDRCVWLLSGGLEGTTPACVCMAGFSSWHSSTFACLGIRLELCWLRGAAAHAAGGNRKPEHVTGRVDIQQVMLQCGHRADLHSLK